MVKKKQQHPTRKTKPVFRDPDVKSYLESLLRRFVSVAIDKATNDFTFSNKPYISKPLTEVGLSNSKSKTWSKATLSTKKKV